MHATAGKAALGKINVIMAMIANDDQPHAIRSAIVGLATESYTDGMRDGAEDAVASDATVRRSMELATTSVKAMEDIASAVARVAEVMERTHPQTYPDPFEECEYVAVEGDEMPESGAGLWWRGKRDGGITHGPAFSDSYRVWRRPASGTGAWERVR